MLAASATLATAQSALAATSSDLASAIIHNTSVITGSQAVSDPSSGQSSLATTTPVAGFPTGTGSYAVLSTGRASDLFTPNSSGNLSTVWNGGSRAGGPTAT
ncbi:hypothetical protein GCM10025868_27760 [Angustibacter aerolatus]|uniref:Uncharacterized protein n=1 Tax=Angustibacter aerolatus TaxID=1162965 RepID=A0ABQ6JJ02_9ACTN|nr:hypothetical protein [Angustibacter aerolatus]GMA87526.1 hypothetical protein GCM10025868_27760 [Angustibacter aerolatus]